MKKLFKLITSLLLYAVTAKGQNGKPAVQELKIGDRLPDVFISSIFRSPCRSLKVSDLYKGGLLLIDFWATWCGPCIEEMQKLDSLKRKFGDSVNVVCMGYENSKTVDAYFARHPESYARHLIITTDDTLFVKLFKHQEIPHNIWIDKNGVIRAITGMDQISGENIHKFLVKKDYGLAVKHDVIFNWQQPLHIEDSLLQYRSIFHTHLKDVNVAGSVISLRGYDTANMSRFYEFNADILTMYWNGYALQTGGGIPNYSLIELHVRDSVKYYPPELNMPLFKKSHYKSRDEWLGENTYFYELRLPHPVKDSIFYSYVQNDLARIFHIRSSIEYKTINCIVVTKQSGQLNMTRTTHKVPEIYIKNNVLIIKDERVGDIFNWLTEMTLNTHGGRKEPYTNQTNITYPVDMTVDLGTGYKELTLAAIENKLMSYGFSFQNEKCSHAILTITDDN